MFALNNFWAVFGDRRKSDGRWLTMADATLRQFPLGDALESSSFPLTKNVAITGIMESL